MRKIYITPEIKMSVFDKDSIVTTSLTTDVRNALTDSSSGLKVNGKTLNSDQVAVIKMGN